MHNLFIPNTNINQLSLFLAFVLRNYLLLSLLWFYTWKNAPVGSRGNSLGIRGNSLGTQWEYGGSMVGTWWELIGSW